MLVTGGSLEDLGMPTHILLALRKVKQPQDMVQDIEPPFASEIGLDVKLEHIDAPAPQNLGTEPDDGE
jgi:hypothetical protein